MSLFSTIQGDAAEAQELMAQMAGKTATGTNALYNGAAITIHFGSPLVQEVPAPGGAYRRRVAVPASFTRSQVSAPPDSKKNLTRTDMTPHITYRIDHVDTHDPIRYNVLLVKLGE